MEKFTGKIVSYDPERKIGQIQPKAGGGKLTFAAKDCRNFIWTPTGPKFTFAWPPRTGPEVGKEVVFDRKPAGRKWFRKQYRASPWGSQVAYEREADTPMSVSRLLGLLKDLDIKLILSFRGRFGSYDPHAKLQELMNHVRADHGFTALNIEEDPKFAVTQNALVSRTTILLFERLMMTYNQIRSVSEMLSDAPIADVRVIFTE